MRNPPPSLSSRRPLLTAPSSFLPRHLHYVTIPVHSNAVLKSPEDDGARWPAMVFSHGLGGGRNSYSYIAGSLASHGVVVFCPEHRDGSAVVSFVRDPAAAEAPRLVPYRKISHYVCPELYAARDAQLRVRLWELGLLHDAMLAMDAGRPLLNLNPSASGLDHFAGRLQVHEPGSIVFAGHSFGAATVVQLLKCTYYAAVADVAAMRPPLFAPAEGSSIRRQLTEKTPTMLLDMWCTPLLSPDAAPLFNLPLPVYADVPSAPGGGALLAVESEAFYKWTDHLHVKARLLSPDPAAASVTASMFERPSGIRLAEPNFFYVAGSAHLSQSDFGVLFPRLTKKIFDAAEPERALRLNLRAQLQLLRANGVPVARTCAADLVDGAHADKPADAPAKLADVDDDWVILERSAASIVDHWRWIDPIGLGQPPAADASTATSAQRVEAADEDMAAELEPAAAAPLPVPSPVPA